MRVVSYEAGRIIPAEGREMAEPKGYWWCANCREEVGAWHVTYQEMHEQCGHPVTWMEPSQADELTRLRDENDRLRSALRPFALLADSWTVQVAIQRGEMLTLSNGERMCGMEASDFINARAALAAVEEGDQ